VLPVARSTTTRPEIEPRSTNRLKNNQTSRKLLRHFNGADLADCASSSLSEDTSCGDCRPLTSHPELWYQQLDDKPVGTNNWMTKPVQTRETALTGAQPERAYSAIACGCRAGGRQSPHPPCFPFRRIKSWSERSVLQLVDHARAPPRCPSMFSWSSLPT
jgi:hypothetical protein